MSITQKTVLVQSQDVPSTEIDGGRVFLDMESGDYISLEGSGSAIWEALATPLAVEELMEQLSRRFGIEPARCQEDTLPFLKEMLDSGLLREVPPSEAS